MGTYAKIRFLRTFFWGLVCLFLTRCGTTSFFDPSNAATTLVGIVISPSSLSIAKGRTARFTAAMTYGDGSTRTITSDAGWTIYDSTFSQVLAASGGQWVTTATGSWRVAASYMGVTGTLDFTVTAPEIVSIAVTPANTSVALGVTQQYTATATYTDASTGDVTSAVTWSATSGTGSASINSSGLATSAGGSMGTVTIAATSGSVSNNTILTVNPKALVSIAVTPANTTVALGLTQQYTATATYTDASTADISGSVTWSKTNATGSASINGTGLASTSGGAIGTVTVTATSGLVSGNTTLNVGNKALVSIAVTPANTTVALGLTQQYTATGTYTDASTADLTGTTTWSKTNGTGSATINSSGLASTSGGAVGTVTITATTGSISGNTTLNVGNKTLVSVAVTPANASVALGLTQQYTATGTYTDASTADLTGSVTWSRTNGTGTATISAGGLANTAGGSIGTVTITATTGSTSGITTLNVAAKALVSIAISPTSATIPLGLTQSYTATGTYTDSSTADITTTVTWSRTNGTGTATIDGVGNVTTTAVGSVTITATAGALSGNTGLTVGAATLVSIAVTPANSSISIGLTQQYTATGTYTDSSTSNLTGSVAWSRTNGTGTAAISSGGLVDLSSGTIGTVTITATAGAISGNTGLTVVDTRGMVQTATSSSATSRTPQRKIIYDAANAFYYAFSYSGSAIQYARSTDGLNWTAGSTLAQNTTQFSVAYKVISSTPYIFLAAEANTFDVVLYRGVPAADGTIAWDAVQTVYDGTSGSDTYGLPSVTIDSADMLWVAARYDLGASIGLRYSVQTKTTTTAANAAAPLTFATASRPTQQMSALTDFAIIPRSSGNINLVVNTGSQITGYYSSGAAWVPANTGGDFNWLGFGTYPTADITCVAVVSGTVYAGGSFGVLSYSGGTWSPLGTGTTGDPTVNALAVVGTDLYVGGKFKDAGGVANTLRIARWDGTAWHALGAGLNSTVTSLHVAGSDLYVGGAFTNAGGIAAADYLAKWDGASWSEVGAGLNGSVNAIYKWGADIYVGGIFTSANGVANTAYLARWDTVGNTWNSLGVMNNNVNEIVKIGSYLYLAGTFTSADSVANTQKLARWSSGGGFEAVGPGGFVGAIHGLGVLGSTLYVVGTFNNGFGVSGADNLVSFDGSVFNLVTTVPNDALYTAVADGTNLYFGGSTPPLATQKALSVWDGTTLTPLTTSTVNGTVNSVAFYNNEIYLGGEFTDWAGIANADNIVKWNGSTWSAVGTGANKMIDVMKTAGGYLYVGGNFTSAGGVANTVRVARWDGSSWGALGTGVNGHVYSMLVSGSSVYFGGSFTDVNGIAAADYVATWSGSAWSAVGSGLTGAVRAIGLVGATLYVGGDFVDAGGDPNADYVARWSGSAWDALGTTPLSNTVHALVGNSGVLYLGGNFVNAGGVAGASFVASWNGSSYSAIGSATFSTVHGLMVSGGDLYVGGSFELTDIQVANGIAKWDGTTWFQLDTGLVGGSVQSMTFINSDLWIAGSFIQQGSTAMSGVAVYQMSVAKNLASAKFSLAGDTTTWQVAYSDTSGAVKYKTIPVGSAQSWGSETVLSAANSDYPSMGLLSNGNPVVCWVRSGNILEYKKWSGAAWGATTAVSSHQGLTSPAQSSVLENSPSATNSILLFTDAVGSVKVRAEPF